MYAVIELSMSSFVVPLALCCWWLGIPVMNVRDLVLHNIGTWGLAWNWMRLVPKLNVTISQKNVMLFQLASCLNVEL